MSDEIDIEIELPGTDGAWTEVDTARPPRPAGTPRSRQRRWQFAAVGAVVVLVAVGLTRRGGHDGTVTATTRQPVTADDTTVAEDAAAGTAAPGDPSGTQALSAAPPSSDATPGPAPARPDRFALDGPSGRVTVPVAGLALDRPTGLRVAAVGTAGRLYDIDVDAGTVTVLDTPASGSGAPTWIAAGADWVLVRPYDDVPAYLVGADGTRSSLEGVLADGTRMLLRGPGRTVWVLTSSLLPRSTETLSLVSIDGGVPLGPVVAIDGIDVLGSDGLGGVLVRSTGGTYLYGGADPSSPVRVSTGDVVATSPTWLLTVECDDALACSRWLVDRRTGERRRVGDDLPRAFANHVGSVSPDGTHAVVLRTDDLRRWEVVSTVPGSPSVVPMFTLDVEQPAELAWSDDGRYVVYLGAGRLWRLDVTTGEDQPLVPSAAGLPDLLTFAGRIDT